MFLSLHKAELFQAKWTDEILDEMIRNLTSNRPDIADRIKRTRSIMKEMPDTLVSNYDHLTRKLRLPDPDDRHVLAAAIHCKASIIVTDNLKHFPDSVLSEYKIIANSPDRFLSDLLQSNPNEVINVITNMSDKYDRPPIKLPELLDSFARNNRMPKAVEIIREFLNQIDS